MNSVIYTGFVGHTRFMPVYHQLRYPLYFYGLDLDELEALDRKLPLFGYNRFRPASIYDADYLDYGPGRIRDKLKALLKQEGLDTPIRRVVLITSARYFNYIFNPVSFYCCFSASDELAAVVAEVNNTFGERHVYIPSPAEEKPDNQSGERRFVADKNFFVSPFNTLDGSYEFFFSPLSPELNIRINLIRDGEIAFKARLYGTPKPLTAGNHLATMLRHPLTPHLTMARILWQAAKLRLGKKLPFQEKPIPTHPMTIRPYPDRLVKNLPESVGPVNDSLQPCPDRPNCVSSMAENSRHYIPPIQYSSSPEEARTRLLDILYSLSRTTVISGGPHYIHAVSETRMMRFKDDLELLIDEGARQIHVRSAARTGYSDFGVNRRRVEKIRRLFEGRGGSYMQRGGR